MPRDNARTGERTDPWARSDVIRTIKFAPPPLPHRYVARPRLDALLDASRTAPFTLLSAPAGAGKSVLLAAWATRNAPRVAWITLDATDDEPDTLWADFNHSISTLSGGRRASAPAHHYVVLDDAHKITSADGHRSLAELIDSLPESIHLLVGSRSQPELPWHRLRITGSAAEIHARELRFTVGEAIDLFSSADRSDIDCSALVDRTDGWATGLVLEAMTRGDGDDVEADIRDFLRQEVIAHQPEATQRFLSETACLEYVSVALGEHITGRVDADELLRRLERDNAFVSAVDHESGRYVYQRQFRALLYDDLRSRDPARAEAIHRDAARWYEERDDVAEAMEQWLAAGDADNALLLLRAANARYGDTQPQLVGSWIARIDTQNARGDIPLLLDLAASCALTRDDDRLADVLARVEALLVATPDSESEIRYRMLRARLEVGRADIEAFATRLESAQRLLRTDPLLAREGLLDLHPRGRRLDPWLALGYAWLDRPEDARTVLRNRPYTSFEDHLDQLFVWGVEAWVELAAGNLDDALALAVRSSRAAEELGIDDFLVWPAWQVVAAVTHERDQLPAARATLVELAQRSAEPRGNVFAVAAQVELAAVARSEGNGSESLERLSRLRRDTGAVAGPAARAWIDGATVQTLLRLGQVNAAREVLGPYPYPGSMALPAALVELAAGEANCARGQAESIRATTPRRDLAASLLKARAALLQGNDDAAMANAARAMQVAQERGFVRTVADLGSELLPLFAATAASAADAEFIAELRNASRRAPSILDARRSASGAIELSTRELEVVSYLPTQLSVREIAQALYVSPNTVKSHLRHAYRKLGVDSRESAIERARLLQLLR